MLIKSDPDQIQTFLTDASYVKGGTASRVLFPESAKEVAEIIARASTEKTPVTISGAGTGTVAGRVPFGGVVLATDRLNRIGGVVNSQSQLTVAAEAGVVLHDLQRAVEAESLFYPPNPTETSCFIGGTIATNASGSRTFKYGPTRNYVERLKIALATGDIVDIRRGEIFAAERHIDLPLQSGKRIQAQLPSYSMPHVRKHASGYYVAPGMDVIDLFIGSEGTLGVILEAELKVLPKPEQILSGVVFFDSQESLLSFVSAVRATSLEKRARAASAAIDARVLEYFDRESLRFLRQKYDSIPEQAMGAVFFEQELTPETEDFLMAAWLSLLEQHAALADDSWFATTEADQEKLREFRHQLPVLMNEWFSRYNQRKVSTDMAVPDKDFPGILQFHEELLVNSGLRYTIFGHIGDNHVHVNILPRNDEEAAAAWKIYRAFIKRAIEVGGTVSAEHGIGKLKREYLLELYGADHLREMAQLKKAFDPAGILGRGNMFAEEYLE
jgi:D-lactate dehydrogenase (cytochrome)